MEYGLLGRKLGHSFSKEIHEALNLYSYDLYEREEQELEAFTNSDIKGFNVTIPYKETIMPYLDELTDRAQKMGCVNSVVKRNGKIIGDNTDYFGFDYLLSSFKTDFSKAIILGDGATSKTIKNVLKDRNISYVNLSRKKPPFYSDIKDFKDYDLLINATPVGMYPNTGESLVNLDSLDNLKAVVDVIYNPYITELLFLAREKNIAYRNGLTMLVGQAIEAARFFTGEDISYDKIDEIVSMINSDKNIVLIGMPGAGKTSLGRKLSKLTGKVFVDSDLEIKRIYKKAPSQIIKEESEEKFRKLETELLEKISKEKNQVIATGGGVVTRAENYKNLKKNSIIYFVDRDLDKLELTDRPLSTDIDRLWKERKKLYQKFSDRKVFNDEIDVAARKIKEDFYENTCD